MPNLCGCSLIIADNNGGLRVMHGDWSTVGTLVPPSLPTGPRLRDGPLDRARMTACDGLCLSREGSIVIADSGNHAIRLPVQTREQPVPRRRVGPRRAAPAERREHVGVDQLARQARDACEAPHRLRGRPSERPVDRPIG